MPFSIKKVDGGYQVSSPNHPEGHSSKPMTHKNAIAQKLIMERAEFGDEPPPSKRTDMQVRDENTARRIKMYRDGR